MSVYFTVCPSSAWTLVRGKDEKRPDAVTIFPHGTKECRAPQAARARTLRSSEFIRSSSAHILGVGQTVSTQIRQIRMGLNVYTCQCAVTQTGNNPSALMPVSTCTSRTPMQKRSVYNQRYEIPLAFCYRLQVPCQPVPAEIRVEILRHKQSCVPCQRRNIKM